VLLAYSGETNSFNGKIMFGFLSRPMGYLYNENDINWISDLSDYLELAI